MIKTTDNKHNGVIIDNANLLNHCEDEEQG